MEGEVRARAAGLGLRDAVDLAGFVDGFAGLGVVDVVAQLSVWENCSYTILDAIRSGCGVVATDVGGNAELLPSRCLVPPGDIDAAAAALVRQGSDPEQRPRLRDGWPTVADQCAALAVDAREGPDVKLLEAREVAPNWLRQVGRAMLALGLGVAVGLSSSEPQLMLGIAVVIATVLVVASLRRPDPLVFLAFAVVAMPKVRIPGLPVPAGEVLMLIAVTSAWLTRGPDHLPIPRWFRWAALAVLAIYLFSSLVNGLVDYSMLKRMIHMSVYVLIALCLGREMLPTKMAAKGLTVGLVVSSLSGMLLFSKSAYSGRLTGVFGDPNVAGFLLAVIGPVVLSRVENRLIRVALALTFLVTIGLTLSRTALLAVVVFGAWFVIGKRLRRGQALLLIGLLVITIGMLPTSIQSIGPFKDRAGSDQLRNRVSDRELTSVGESPIWGHGAGTATVRVNTNDVKLFFHNSYLALLNEEARSRSSR